MDFRQLFQTSHTHTPQGDTSALRMRWKIVEQLKEFEKSEVATCWVNKSMFKWASKVKRLK